MRDVAGDGIEPRLGQEPAEADGKSVMQMITLEGTPGVDPSPDPSYPSEHAAIAGAAAGLLAAMFPNDAPALQAMAQEAALKLKETSGIHAEGFSAAEVMHGPLELVGKDFPVFAFCPADDAERFLHG